MQQLVMEKDLQLGEMSSSVQERQLMLQQSHTRIVELEEGQSQLEAQVQISFSQSCVQNFLSPRTDFFFSGLKFVFVVGTGV